MTSRSNPIHFHSIQDIIILGILRPVSGSLRCASVPFTGKATINAAGCAHLHDTHDEMDVHAFMPAPHLPFLAS
jgi:hypothetical protein